jgi:threonine/homoserine/homoserine lactone efflux protein
MIDWMGFLPTALAISLIPGANQLLGLSNAARHGLLPALAGVAGRLFAFVILIGLVVAGLGAVLAASGTALEVIRWVGVVYLAWLGTTSLLSARRADDVAAITTRESGVRRIVVHEFAVAISNPKALLLFAAVLPQFVTGTSSEVNVELALLGAAYLGIELVVGLGYLAIGHRLGALGIPSRTQQKIDAGTGVLFLGLAGLLAVEEVA